MGFELSVDDDNGNTEQCIKRNTCGAEMFMYLYKHQWFIRYSYVTMQLVDLCVYGEM